MSLLYGLHDREGAPHVPAGGWCVDTVALADNPAPTDYAALRSDINWLTRLNWGYGSTGTLPRPEQYGDYVARALVYVQHSRGCHRWIIGNEPNHRNERPHGQLITPDQYAECFTRTREAIRSVQPDAQVITAAVAPWNLETGDWLDYHRTMLAHIAKCDGIAIHAYTHGADPALVTSDEQVNGWHWHLRVYRDMLAAIPAKHRGLPVYITESNQGDHAWADTNSGWVQAAYAEIHRHNQAPGTQKIHCLCLYRWPTYDRWSIVDKPGVIADFQAAAAKGYPSPVATVAASQPHQTHLPKVEVSEPPTPPAPPRHWDARLDARGVTVQPAQGTTAWRVVRGEWQDEQQAQGRHHIYVTALDESGARVNVPVKVTWPGGAHTFRTDKPANEPGGNYPMSPSRNEFSVQVDDGTPSDTVSGIGMGAETPGGFNAGIHTSTAIVFQRQRGQTVQPAPSKPQPVAQPATVPPLTHPIADPAQRIVSQPFGVNPERYARFGLAGHNGVDFAVPVGTPVHAVDDGEVVETLIDPDGYGVYVKLHHVWGHSLYAHLHSWAVLQGAKVRRGQLVGTSGNSGNSTGPHLHFGLRVNPFTRGHPYDGYTDPLPYLTQPGPAPARHDLLPLIEAAAREFGLDWQLLASMVYAESRFDVQAKSGAGAMGLTQIMPSTWDEWAGRVGARDPYAAQDNLRVGAAYLAWCVQQCGGDRIKALVAYNVGIGNVQNGVPAPLQTKLYAYGVVLGADLLTALGSGR